jgi:hypothetical protein
VNLMRRRKGNRVWSEARLHSLHSASGLLRRAGTVATLHPAAAFLDIPARGRRLTVIMVSFHNLVNAKVHVNYVIESGQWSSAISVLDADLNEVTFFTGQHEHKVQALMAAFDIVGMLQAAVQKLADAEGMADLEASAKEAVLIAGGTEALPEFNMVEYTEKVLDLVSESVKKSLDIS